MNLYNKIESFVNAWKQARQDEEWTLSEALEVTRAAASLVETAAGSFVGTDEEWNDLVKDVEKLVQEYVVPFDIPGIGPFFEGLVDAQLVNLVRPFMDHLRPEPPTLN